MKINYKNAREFLLLKISKFNPKRFLKFILVGLSSAFFSLIVLLFCIEILEFNILLGSFIAYIVGIINGFLINNYWTFKNNSKNKRYQKLVKYIVIYLLGLLIYLFVIDQLANVHHIWYILANLIASGIMLIWNYLGNLFWTYKS